MRIPASAIVIASVLIPVGVLVLLNGLRPRTLRERGALALGFAWNAVTLVVVNHVAVAAGWWSFPSGAGPGWAGLPLLLLTGWAGWWGVVAPLARFHPVVMTAVLGVIDLALMPRIPQVLALGPNWLIGEAMALAVVALPGLFAVRWTERREALGPLTVLQVFMFAALLLFVVPGLLVGSIGAVPAALADQLSVWHLGVVVGLAGLIFLPSLTAVHDFYLNGGTPWPWDSTDRPVLTGAYRYLRSPMQLSASLVVLAMGLLLRHPLLPLAASMGMGMSTFFSMSEANRLSDRFGPVWADMALSQRRWIPSFRPHPQSGRARIWVNMGCDVCRPLATFLTDRNPVGLEVLDAATHPGRLVRVHYLRSDGQQFSGMRAVGAALEHLHLGWAMLGFLLRFPGLWRVWQGIGDRTGFGPRPATPPLADPVDEVAARRTVESDGR